ncbi:hypothetical protein [Caldibacillus debilis]|uniref:hypothetical protein n=1 Tax=Caldibacillus debilis TaxID=301148 RepID=UPI0011C41FE1|nr:hypothetical protein [Caldibacillus debilis]
MYKVISPFRDKFNPEKIYHVGDPFESDDKERIADLISRKLIEGVPDGAPSFHAAEHNEYQLMTKKEIIALLKKKGIEFNSRQPKEELIRLLLGGG